MIPSHKIIIYITRDIERALGFEPCNNYRIVANETPYSLTIKNQYPDYVTLIKSTSIKLLSTSDLVSHEITKQLIEGLQNTNQANDDSQQVDKPFILVFKNSLRVETAIKERGWQCLNPKSLLSERVENKFSQIRWLGDMAQNYLPPHVAKVTKLITWKNDPFIIQWAHGHTGDGTLLIRTREELSAIQENFPERLARLSTYIKGSSFTVNAIVTTKRILIGNISYQITGLPPFTDNEFSTIGNDWVLANKILGQKEIGTVWDMVNKIGSKLQQDGWRGLFGVDLIREDQTNRVFLIEVNARQPASTTFESFLQDSERRSGQNGLTTFEAHIRALLDLPIDQDLVTIRSGAQIIQRVTKNVQGLFNDVGDKLKKNGFEVVVYENTDPNADLIRVQTLENFMENPGLLNHAGREIAETIKSSGFNLKV